MISPLLKVVGYVRGISAVTHPNLWQYVIICPLSIYVGLLGNVSNVTRVVDAIIHSKYYNWIRERSRLLPNQSGIKAIKKRFIFTSTGHASMPVLRS